MKKLGKKASFEKGTFVAYGCATCYCTCVNCTNCTGNTLQSNGTYYLDVAKDSNGSGAYNMPYVF